MMETANNREPIPSETKDCDSSSSRHTESLGDTLSDEFRETTHRSARMWIRSGSLSQTRRRSCATRPSSVCATSRSLRARGCGHARSLPLRRRQRLAKCWRVSQVGVGGSHPNFAHMRRRSVPHMTNVIDHCEYHAYQSRRSACLLSERVSPEIPPR